ncbi:MinD superfamily P-loop ATPase containing an inserted ferredoxin domain [Dissulfuribacter thermophilus]|uniref:MinD superfamily P-loop ATPase containing an inserted ferredoxin domain n=1 Tax=Dissulfuribacter thermophilus TaxID=1156395 RepID=A0A1B9F5J9_9BACT|nr:ATP-binding protein [Dissulfuribacter thermophilus]OCC15192.1 MinD superfamily P-loop ATPase containing an inserted ferredoxin domain [Dissulfuribacter thermophilus]
MARGKNGKVELVILSGKGGTGKTTFTASLAALLSEIVIVDCDVDASNLFLLLNPKNVDVNEFYSGQKPVINSDLCSKCLTCQDVCNFDAIYPESGKVDDIACEGCGVCAWFCPEGAIDLKENHCGRWYVSKTSYGPMVHADLFPGEENSGKLVYKIKETARDIAQSENFDLILIDGPPGTACPVISTLSGATHAVLVAEPTLSGFSDMKRTLELCMHFKIKTSCLINKADISPQISDEIEKYALDNGITFLGHLPFEEKVTLAMENCTPFVKAFPNSPLSLAIKEVVTKMREWIT